MTSTATPAELSAPTCDEPEWLQTYGTHGSMGQAVACFAVFDDGSGGGPALYAGGSFIRAGTAIANGVARWDGTDWRSVGDGMADPVWGFPFSVYSLAVYDDGSGSGPALFAGGVFSYAGGTVAKGIAKWDGKSWTPLGSGLTGSPAIVHALTVFDDGLGGGPALYVGGRFDTAGGVDAHGIAKWNGKTWTPLGSGAGGTTTARVRALAIFDDGSGRGPALYATGAFTTIGGVEANRIARWDGVEWAPLGDGLANGGYALSVFDDGSGSSEALYVGGSFTSAGGAAAHRIARWDGTTWSPLGSGMDGAVHAFTVFDDGSGGGPALYAGGSFTTAGGRIAYQMARWDGAEWTALKGNFLDDGSSVYALFGRIDPSSGQPILYVGGFFYEPSGAFLAVAKWDGAMLLHLGSGLNGDVRALKAFDDGSGRGQALYAGGEFTNGGGIVMNRVARWDGSTWSPLGSGMNGHVHALEVFDDGAGGGPALYAGGSFTIAGGVEANYVAKWDGTAWTPVGAGVNSIVRALTVYDDGSGSGPALFAGGNFTMAGGAAANRIARWDGATWAALADGISGGVRSLTVFDDGTASHPALYAGGSFSSAGGIAANGIARWDGTAWSALGSGVGGAVYAMTSIDDVSDAALALYAGGDFTTAGGVTAKCIARWDGTSWTAVGAGMLGGYVYSLAVYEMGPVHQPTLIAGGSFIQSGAKVVNSIAKWEGTAWSPMGSGMNGAVFAMTAFDDGSAPAVPALHVGGGFTISPAGDSFLAKWGCDAADPPCAIADINCDGLVDGTDLAVVLGAWGTCGSPPCAADLNGDGEIDGSDLAILLGSWG